MTITGVLILTLLFTVGILAMALTATAKRADKAMAEAIQNCTRPAPRVHVHNKTCWHPDGTSLECGYTTTRGTFPSWMEKWEEEAKAEKKGRSMLL